MALCELRSMGKYCYIIMSISSSQKYIYRVCTEMPLLPSAEQYFIFSSFLICCALRAQQMRNGIIRKHHTAVYPEPACPELAEASKGRLYATPKRPPHKSYYYLRL